MPTAVAKKAQGSFREASCWVFLLVTVCSGSRTRTWSWCRPTVVVWLDQIEWVLGRAFGKKASASSCWIHREQNRTLLFFPSSQKQRSKSSPSPLSPLSFVLYSSERLSSSDRSESFKSISSLSSPFPWLVFFGERS